MEPWASTDTGDQASAEGLVSVVRRGAVAVIIIEGLHQILNLCFLAVLYRVLGLEPYGLLAMVVPVLFLSRILVFSGLDVATIQRPSLGSEQLSAIFWIQQLLGLAGTAGVACCAPLVAWFYSEPRLVAVTLAAAGTNLAASAGIQHFALLQRRLRLGLAAAIRMWAGVAGSVSAIAAAWSGWGIWALVLQMYVELISLALLSWWCEPFRPKLYLRGVGAGRLVQFGGQCTWGQIMYFLVTQFDKIYIGYVLGARPVGLYGQAYNLASKPVQLVISRLTGVMLPALSRAAQNPQQFRILFLGFMRVIGLTMFPMGIGLALVGKETMTLLGGREWQPAGPILAILGLMILFQGFVQSFGSVLAALGQGRLLVTLSTALAAILCGAVVLGLRIGLWMGQPLTTVAFAYVTTLAMIVFPLYSLKTLRAGNVPVTDLVQALWPSARAAAFMGITVFCAGWFLDRSGVFQPAIRLGILVPLGIVSYLGFSWKECRNLAEKIFPLGVPFAGTPSAPTESFG
jgi:PST family polysaccharide transporter